ncbi:DNA-binding transcriptional regulator BolA-like [Watersipora subatra]|uniref:DNA-binding transcriptional regulator BolA-like n=1 Tax=Watersipora subatra TaxID=2589382 RepID=UPI00355BB47B
MRIRLLNCSVQHLLSYSSQISSLGSRLNARFLRMADVPGPVQSAVTIKLQRELKPEHLDVINESHMHNVPKGTESHFKVIIVSEQFQGKPLIQRHKLVHSVLHEELDTGAIHALGIQAKTPEQWAKSQQVPESPKCMGGSGK